MKLIITGTRRPITKRDFKKFKPKIEKVRDHPFLKIGDYYVTHMFASNVRWFSKFKDVEQVIFLGMAIGFENIKVSDYCLPTEFASTKTGWQKGKSIAVFKEREVKDEHIFKDHSKILKMNNILAGEEYKKILGKKINQKGKRVITSPYSLLTPYNSAWLREQGFNLGEMESYYVASMTKRRGLPFGCLMVCTDDLDHDIREGLEIYHKSFKRILKRKDKDKLLPVNFDEELRKKFLKYLATKQFTDLDKVKRFFKMSKEKNYRAIYEKVQKETFKHSSEVNVFTEKIKELHEVACRLIESDL